MSLESNKKLARRLYDEVLNDGKIGVIAEIATAGYHENHPLPGQGTGRQGLTDRVTILRTALAPHFTILDTIAEGDRVVVRWSNSGTQVGEWFGAPATGRKFTIEGIDIYRVENDLLVEHWHVVDALSMLGQLGLLPQSAEA